MALTNCNECNKKVSTFASSCPHCGTPSGKMIAPKRSYAQNNSPSFWAELSQFIDSIPHTAQCIMWPIVFSISIIILYMLM
jgi:predicted amidophosphoribosyltransferase